MRPKNWLLALALVVGSTAIIAASAACSGGAKDGSALQTSAPAPTQSNSTAHTNHAAEIDQQNLTFIPARVSIKVGETVLIKNSESPIHTANINGTNITGNMKKGDSIAWTAKTAGEYKVTCDYHPAMSATIVVK